jgi:hypothetical protein
LKYVADTTNYAVAAKGDLLVGTAADTLSALSVGTDGYTLVADSAETTGLKWQAPASSTPSFVGCVLGRTSDQSISNNTNTAVQWDTEQFDTDAFHDNSTNNTRVTIPSGKGGKYLVVGNAANDSGATSDAGRMYASLYKNGVQIQYTFIDISTGTANYESWLIHTIVDLTAGDYIEWFVYQSFGKTVNLSAYSALCVQYLGA